MANRRLVPGLLILLLAGCATPRPHWQDPSLHSISRDSLVRFESREEFDGYLDELLEAADRYDMWWAYRRANPGAGLMAQAGDVPPCDPEDEDCAGMVEEIVMTGSRVQRSSITNNQEIGVDEGDIVKLYKDFLIVLQDGRLFSVSIGESASELALIDRMDIYASPEDDV